MKLHILGLAHTVTDQKHSHCAFTGKVLKFPKMMEEVGGPPMVHYGVQGAQTLAAEHIEIMTREEQNQLRGHDGSDKTKFHGDDANSGNPLYKEFNKRLRRILMDTVDVKNDIVLLPFGHAHFDAIQGRHYKFVESGIGYPELYPGNDHYRVFESYAWMHWHHGKDGGRNGRNYEWVIPNYFDLDEWEINTSPKSNRVVFLGRIDPCKGLDTVWEMAKHRPDLEFEIAGQGDPKKWLDLPNLRYVGPLFGTERSEYLGNAMACVMPTNFSEPFGGVAVEAMLCGTPVLTTSFGAFTETIEDQVTGFRCHTLGDFLAALVRVPDLDRSYIAQRAERLYGFDRIGNMYLDVFDYIKGLQGEGWYEMRSKFGTVVSKVPPLEGWEKAQKLEGKFHANEKFRPNEKRKQRVYSMMLDLAGYESEIKGRRIIDVGSGPQPLLLDWAEEGKVHHQSAVLDPLTFSNLDEERFKKAGLRRFTCRLEDVFKHNPGEFDEVWCYNVLQHVEDLNLCFENLKSLGMIVRIWEWIDDEIDDLHLHQISVEGIKEAFKDWEPVAELEGVWRQDSYQPAKFFSAVYRR